MSHHQTMLCHHVVLCKTILMILSQARVQLHTNIGLIQMIPWGGYPLIWYPMTQHKFNAQSVQIVQHYQYMKQRVCQV